MPGEANAIRDAEGDTGGDASDIRAPVEVDAFEMAQRMSIVMTAWPVLRSHCLSVLSLEPVTYSTSARSIRGLRTYQAIAIKVKTGHILRMRLEGPYACRILFESWNIVLRSIASHFG
jgi:hypothetical protein